MVIKKGKYYKCHPKLVGMNKETLLKVDNKKNLYAPNEIHNTEAYLYIIRDMYDFFDGKPHKVINVSTIEFYEETIYEIDFKDMYERFHWFEWMLVSTELQYIIEQIRGN